LHAGVWASGAVSLTGTTAVGTPTVPMHDIRHRVIEARRSDRGRETLCADSRRLGSAACGCRVRTLWPGSAPTESDFRFRAEEKTFGLEAGTVRRRPEREPGRCDSGREWRLVWRRSGSIVTRLGRGVNFLCRLAEGQAPARGICHSQTRDARFEGGTGRCDRQRDWAGLLHCWHRGRISSSPYRRPQLVPMSVAGAHAKLEGDVARIAYLAWPSWPESSEVRSWQLSERWPAAVLRRLAGGGGSFWRDGSAGRLRDARGSWIRSV
jgi:hypothetical protein